MKSPTLFSWGYWGWGTSTEQLVEAVDAVEKGRGFTSPIFVDIRIRRSVRATGFKEKAFQILLGEDRYKWMPSLGNLCIIEDFGGAKVKIKNPAAAKDLLDLALDELKNRNRRILFFCACQPPQRAKECHRNTVGSLLLKEARKQKQRIEVIEWPGEEPKHIEVEVTPQILKAIERGTRSSIPLGKPTDLVQVAGLPWCSIVTVRSNGESLNVIAGPAIFDAKAWILKIYEPGIGLSDEKLMSLAARLRRSWGLESRT